MRPGGRRAEHRHGPVSPQLSGTWVLPCARAVAHRCWSVWGGEQLAGIWVLGWAGMPPPLGPLPGLTPCLTAGFSSPASF